MAQATFKGNPVTLSGDLPAEGTQAPDFKLVAKDLSEKSLADFEGKRKILSINMSYDTGVCQAAARKFNETVSQFPNTVVLLISNDLPFAQKRLCEAEGLNNVVTLSGFRSSFAEDYGLLQKDGPLKGLSGRAVVVLDENNKVIKTQQNVELAEEPKYDQISAALS